MKIGISESYIRFLVFIIVLIVLIVGGGAFNVDNQKINSFLQRVPFIYSWLAFILLYVIGTFFIWYLKDPLKIVGAVVFGAYISTLLIYISEIINAYIFFNISSIFGKGFVEERLRGKFKAFYEKLEGMNLVWVFILRAAPLVPYRVLDLSFGLSKFSFRKYLLIIILASLPRIFIIQFVLAAVGGFSVLKIFEYFQNNTTVLIWVFFYSFFALLAVIKITKKAQ